MTTIKTPVHALNPGDVLLDPLPNQPGAAKRYVVLGADGEAGGPRRLQLGCLDEIPARLATVVWIPGALVDVDVPGLTPAQAQAEALLVAVEKVLDTLTLPGLEAVLELRTEWEPPARALVARARPRPTKPPTLAEALAVLAAIRTSGASGVGVENGKTADDLLERARCAGVLA